MRLLALLFSLCGLWGCASPPCSAERARVASRIDGIPETIWPEDASLIEREPRRYCQVVFEPWRATRHAVWFTTAGSSDAHVTVATRAGAEPHTFETTLDATTAGRLKALCHAFLTLKPPACERIVRDGSYYYVAHYEDGGYVMRALVSPKWGTRDDKFVRVAEALRDYAVAPVSMKSVYYSSILRAAEEFEKLECERDAKAVFDCSVYLDSR